MSHRVKPLGGVVVLMLMVMAGGACGNGPTGVTIDPDTTDAAYDGGYMYGSGNREGETGGDAAIATAQSDTTQRGGVLIGSGH